MIRQVFHSYKRLSRRKVLFIFTGLLIIVVINYVSLASIKDYDQTINSIKESLPQLDTITDKLPEIPELDLFGKAGGSGGVDNDDSSKSQNSISKNNRKVISSLFQIIKDADPKLPKLDRYKTEQRAQNVRFDEEKDVVFTKEYLSGFLDIHPDELTALTKSHSQVVAKFSEIKSPKYEGQGIVYVGGGRFNWLALMSVRTLRTMGSNIPVEVLIPTHEDFEPELCNVVFPELNARCIVLPDILGPDTSEKFEIGGFQYKSLAILVSSFESVLLLDADNLPVYIPDHIFNQDPFKSKGLVIWPDFWRRATCPDYYTIANITIDETKRVQYGITAKEKSQTEIPFHHFKGAIPDPTSESGQVLINKTQHVNTMFLSLYYNIYGPSYYYPLLSQGGLGEGDKETFLSAAVALGNPFYQMHENLVALGRFDDKKDFHGVAMGQFDPVKDFDKYEGGNKDGITSRILFIHANFPKLNPVLIKNEGKLFASDNGNDAKRVRIYGPNMASRIGYDFESYQWNNMNYLLCESKVQLKIFENENITEICDDIHLHQNFLKTTTYPLWGGQLPQD